MAYKNGYLPASALTTVQGSMQLENRTARAFIRMRDAAAEEDHQNITIAAPEGDYRSWATQLDMRAHPGRYNITPGIVPGLPSEHGLGTCVDIGQGLAWVKSNGRRFGFTFPLAFDPNHARYDGVTVADLATLPFIPEKPKPKKEGLMDLTYLSHKDGKRWALVGIMFPNGAITTTDINVANGWAQLDMRGGQAVEDYRWAPTLAAAKAASDAYWARMAALPSASLGNVTVNANNAPLLAKLDEVAARLEAAVDSLNPRDRS